MDSDRKQGIQSGWKGFKGDKVDDRSRDTRKDRNIVHYLCCQQQDTSRRALLTKITGELNWSMSDQQDAFTQQGSFEQRKHERSKGIYVQR